jgi:hypothetical protein
MEAVFRGFLERQQFHRSLGCGHFDVDLTNPSLDIIVDRARNDPGVYTFAQDWEQVIQHTHRHAIFVLDAEWDGAPSPQKIRTDMARRIMDKGWARDDFEVIVIEPELESWIWQDNPHVAKAFRFKDGSLRDWLQEQGCWPEDCAKPPRPKEAVKRVGRHTRVGQSSANYKNITNKVSVKNCVDASFQMMASCLRRWFPPEWQ